MPLGVDAQKNPVPALLCFAAGLLSCCGSSSRRRAGGTRAEPDRDRDLSGWRSGGNRRDTETEGVGEMTEPTGGDAVRAVCVTGMHRSGTSFVAGALRFLGVSLGDPERMLRPGPDNPRGYFEVQSIMQLDDELLAHLGGAWDQPPVLDPGWEHDARPRRRSARGPRRSSTTPSGRRAQRPPVIAWKDPRLSLLLPFWRTVTPIATTIVVVRDPVEVAASLACAATRSARRRRRACGCATSSRRPAADPGLPAACGTPTSSTISPARVARLARHLGLPPPDAAVEAGGPRAPRHRACATTTPQRASARRSTTRCSISRARSGTAARVDLGLVPPLVADLLGRGWLRPPLDGELLARARADVVTAARRCARRTGGSRRSRRRLAATERR